MNDHMPLSQRLTFLVILFLSLFTLLSCDKAPKNEGVMEKNIRLLENGFWSGTRSKAAQTLGKIKDRRAVEPLMNALKDRNKDVRIESVLALKKIKDSRAVPSLLLLLKDKDWLVRCRTASALGELRDIRAVEPLIATLKRNSPFVRESAARALAEMKDDRASNAITELSGENISRLTSSYDLEVRLNAITMLGALKDDRAVEPLAKALNDRDGNVRNRAAEALGEIKDVRAVEPLIAALKDEDLWIRQAMADALGDIGDPRAIEPLLEASRQQVTDRGTWIYDIPTPLSKIGDPGLKQLIAALEDESTYVRKDVAEALGLLGNRSAVESLRKNLVDWFSSKKVAVALAQLEWSPESNADKIHLLIARRDRRQLKKNWDLTTRVLLKDVESNDYMTIENALYAFIGIGRKEIIPILVEKLNSKGNKTMAEAYLNCEQPTLDKVARDWAARRGYTIHSGRGAAPVGWGGM